MFPGNLQSPDKDLNRFRIFLSKIIYNFENMKLILLISTLAFLGASAQEPLMPELPEQDTAKQETKRRVMYMQLLSGTLPSGDLTETQQFPEFDFSKALASHYNTRLSGFLPGEWTMNYFIPGHSGFFPSPFFRNGQIFSEGRIPLRGKFSLGGYSFGANSAFSAPFPNQGINTFDTRGSTFFMQYNVSKKFKIETRISVSQGPGLF